MSALPSGSAKNAMWQTPVSSVSALKGTPRCSSVARAPATSSTCSAIALVGANLRLPGLHRTTRPAAAERRGRLRRSCGGLFGCAAADPHARAGIRKHCARCPTLDAGAAACSRSPPASARRPQTGLEASGCGGWRRAGRGSAQALDRRWEGGRGSSVGQPRYDRSTTVNDTALTMRLLHGPILQPIPQSQSYLSECWSLLKSSCSE